MTSTVLSFLCDIMSSCVVNVILPLQACVTWLKYSEAVRVCTRICRIVTSCIHYHTRVHQ